MEVRIEAYYATVSQPESAAIERLFRHLTVFAKDQQEALRRHRDGLQEVSLALPAPRFRRVAE